MRLLPDAIGNQNEFHYDSFDSYLLGYPQYTRPQKIDNEKVQKFYYRKFIKYNNGKRTIF